MKLGIGISMFPWAAEEIGPVVSRDEAALDAVLAILPDVRAIETQVPR